MGSGAINVMVLPNFNHSFDTSLSTCTSEAGVVGVGGVTTLPCCLLHVGLKLWLRMVIVPLHGGTFP
jgi:hypothetical protein